MAKARHESGYYELTELEPNVRDLYRRARFRDAAAAIDDFESRTGGLDPRLAVLRARIALKTDPTFALRYLSARLANARGAHRLEVLLLQGVAYARLRDDVSAREKFAAVAERIDKTHPLWTELAYQRAAHLWMQRKIADARTAVRAIALDGPSDLAIEARVLEGAIEASRGDLFAQAAILLDALRTLEADATPSVLHLAIVASQIAFLARELPSSALRDAAFGALERIPWTSDLADHQFAMTRAVAWRHALEGDEFNAFRELKASATLAPTAAHRVLAYCDRASLALALGERRWAEQERSDAREAADRIDWRTVEGEERFALCLLAELMAPHDAALALSYLARFRSDGPRFARTLASSDDRRVGALEAFSFGIVRAALDEREAAERLLREAFETYDAVGYRWRAARAAIVLADVTGDAAWRERAAERLRDYPRSFLAASLATAHATKVTTLAEAEALTPAQRTIFDLLLRGLSTSEIAQTVGRSEFTVKNHIKAIFKTCNVRSRAALLAKANA